MESAIVIIIVTSILVGLWWLIREPKEKLGDPVANLNYEIEYQMKFRILEGGSESWLDGLPEFLEF